MEVQELTSFRGSDRACVLACAIDPNSGLIEAVSSSGRTFGIGSIKESISRPRLEGADRNVYLITLKQSRARDRKVSQPTQSFGPDSKNRSLFRTKVTIDDVMDAFIFVKHVRTVFRSENDF